MSMKPSISPALPSAPECPTVRASIEVTRRLCALPGVPIVGWADLACAALLPMAPRCAVSFFFGALDHDGTIRRIITTGAAGVFEAYDLPANWAYYRDEPPAIGTTNDPRLTAVRRGFKVGEALPWTGLPPGSTACVLTKVHSLGSVPRSDAVRRRWSEFSPKEMLVTCGWVKELDPAPAMCVEAVRLDGEAWSPSQVSLLDTAIHTLGSRVRVAIGESPLEDDAWLTASEQHVLNQLLEGKSVPAIAESLGRSPHTVHDHVKSLHRKLGATTRGELVARGLGRRAGNRGFATAERERLGDTFEVNAG